MDPEKRQYYDEAFAEVFTNRKIIESLLRDFVNENWIDLIDFSTMEVEKSVFKGIRDNKRESDILLKFNGKLLIFILLEFQSKPDAMLLRLLEYLTRIYRKQYKEMKQLHPVVPIVIYNGKALWKEKNSFSASMVDLPDEIKKYLPDFKYILIDIASYDDALLEDLKDAVSYFFLLDKTDLTSREQASDRILGLLGTLRDFDPEIFTLLGSYISGLLKHRSLEINEINDYLTDRRNGMLAQSIEDLYEEGKAEGLQVGREEGHLTAKVETLLRLIEKKFSLSTDEKQLISASKDAAVIDEALDVILFASNIEEVLILFK